MTFVKTAITNILLLSLLALAMTSCEKVDLGKDSETAGTENFLETKSKTESGDYDEDECFDLVYPVSVDLPGMGTVAANNETELDSLVDLWISQNPNPTSFPTLVYPVQVIWDDGTTETINSDEELEELFEDCFGDDDDCDHDEECAEFVFPVDVLLPNGTTVTANDEDELEDIEDDWYNQNPNDTTDGPQIVLPVQVTLDDSTFTVTTMEELKELWEICEGYDEDFCFDINFPVTVTLPDGTQVTAQDEDDLEEIEDDWYDQNPNSHDDPEINFPFSVTMDDGTVVTVNDEEELDELIDDCE